MVQIYFKKYGNEPFYASGVVSEKLDAMKSTLTKITNALLVISAALFLTPATADAQDKPGKIEGYVLDKDSKDSIAYANMILTDAAGKTTPGMTDLTGYYSFSNLLPGEYHLEVRAVGYSIYKVNGIILTAGQTLNVELKTQAVVLDEIVITESKSEKEHYSNSAKKMNAYG